MLQMFDGISMQVMFIYIYFAGAMIRHEKMGKDVYAAAWQFPLLNIEATIQPITRTVLRVTLDIFADFR